MLLKILKCVEYAFVVKYNKICKNMQSQTLYIFSQFYKTK